MRTALKTTTAVLVLLAIAGLATVTVVRLADGSERTIPAPVPAGPSIGLRGAPLAPEGGADRYALATSVDATYGLDADRRTIALAAQHSAGR